MFVSSTASILHADVDSFFASVEQRDDPRLRGRPVVVGSWVVLAASYEAKAYGIRTAMGGAQARRLCPKLVVVEPRLAAYSEASKAVFEVFDDTTPLVEGISIDEAFLDVRGLERIAGSPPEIAARLRQTVLDHVGLPITVGVARTKFLAKVASGVAKPNGLLVLSPVDRLTARTRSPAQIARGARPDPHRHRRPTRRSSSLSASALPHCRPPSPLRRLLARDALADPARPDGADARDPGHGEGATRDGDSPRPGTGPHAAPALADESRERGAGSAPAPLQPAPRHDSRCRARRHSRSLRIDCSDTRRPVRPRPRLRDAGPARLTGAQDRNLLAQIPIARDPRRAAAERRPPRDSPRAVPLHDPKSHR